MNTYIEGNEYMCEGNEYVAYILLEGHENWRKVGDVNGCSSHSPLP